MKLAQFTRRLTLSASLRYKQRMQLSAILLTAMAMCMHMMCMRTAVGTLQTSRMPR